MASAMHHSFKGMGYDNRYVEGVDMKEIELGHCYQYARKEVSRISSHMENIFWDKMPIKWLVLDDQEDRMLLITKDCIWFEGYNDWFTGSAGNITWNDCTLRHKLNTETPWFNLNEHNRIIRTESESGSDKMFLLTSHEIIKYMPHDTDRIAKPTERAVAELKNKGAYVTKHEDSCEWWLRDKNKTDGLKCMIIRQNGSIDEEGHFFNTKTVGVRPALWIRK